MRPTGPSGLIDTVLWEMHPGAARSRPTCLWCEISEQAVAGSTSRGGGSVRKGEATRQDIIRKAAPISNRKGYSGAALSDLMRATGLEKGGIYRHFESKQELAEDAFDHAWKVAMDTRFNGTQEIPNAVDRLKQIVRNFRDRRAGLVPGGARL